MKMKIRKHIGINQKTGRLKKGYRYSGRRLKNGSAEIVRVLVGGGKASTKKKGKQVYGVKKKQKADPRASKINGAINTGIQNFREAILKKKRFDIQKYWGCLLKKGFTVDEIRHIYSRVSEDARSEANYLQNMRESQRKRQEKFGPWIEKHGMRWDKSDPHRG